MKEMIGSYVAQVRAGFTDSIDTLPAPGFDFQLNEMIQSLRAAQSEMRQKDSKLQDCLSGPAEAPDCLESLGFWNFVQRTATNLTALQSRGTAIAYRDALAVSMDYVKAITLANLWRGGWWDISFERRLYSAFDDEQESRRNQLYYLDQYLAIAPFFNLQIETRSVSIARFIPSFALPRGLAGATNSLQTYDGLSQAGPDGRSQVVRYETPIRFMGHDLNNHNARHAHENFGAFFSLDRTDPMLPAWNFTGNAVELLKQVRDGLKFAVAVEDLLRTLHPLQAQSIRAVLWHVYHEWVGLLRPDFLLNVQQSRFRPKFTREGLTSFLFIFRNYVVEQILDKLESPNDLNFDFPLLHALSKPEQEAELQKAIDRLERPFQ